MASTIFKFPSGSEINTEIVTAYHTANGVDYIVSKTGRSDDNNHEIVGVSYKPMEEDRYQKIVNIEAWKEAKGLLVNDINDQKENFQYMIPEAETLVTEDYIHELALRGENKEKLEANYKEFLQTQQMKKEENQNIVPFPSQETIIPTASVQETVPTIQPAPIHEIQNSIEAQPTPVVNAPIIEDNMSFASMPSSEVKEVSTINPQESVQNTSDNSSVVKYYGDAINALNAQLKDVTNKYKGILDNYENTIKEIGEKTISMLKDGNVYKKYTEENFEKSQQILAAQNTENDVERDLTKVA